MNHPKKHYKQKTSAPETRTRRKLTSLIQIGLVLLMLTGTTQGCSTINSYTEEHNEIVYRGTRTRKLYDYIFIADGLGETGIVCIGIPSGVLDIIFSFVLDTVLLPITIPWAGIVKYVK